MYLMAWQQGLKTTYYLRSLGATRIEKATVDANRYGNPLGQTWREAAVPSPEDAVACAITKGAECEACQ
jgi:ribonucleoside-diphosphate reductase alpha chain